MTTPINVIDAWIAPNPPEKAKAYWETASPGMRAEVANVFHREKEVSGGSTLEQMVREMDEAGVERGVLTLTPPETIIHGWPMPHPEPINDQEWVLKAVERFPGRFIAATRINPLKGMAAVRQLESLVNDHGVRALRLVPFMTNRPPNDKVFYPFYVKCIELGIPVTITVGIPAPQESAEVANPIYLDEVVRFFPELVVVATHMGFPWHQTLISLMVKYPNLYMMTSAWAPRHYPEEIIEYMNTRGSGKIMFASRWPFLSFKRCIEEVNALPLKDGVHSKFLRENALKVFRWGQGTGAGANKQI